MGHRLSKIYTRTGDTGTTGLGDGSRMPKDDLRIAALGDIDELNAIVGVVRAQLHQADASHIKFDQHQLNDWDKKLSLIQHWLFDLGGEVCIPNYSLLQAKAIDFLEQDIDEMNEHLPRLKEFILPSGTLLCSYTHQARAVCRRAERSLIALQERDQNIQATALQLLNRLSDWFFVASRRLQLLQGGTEVLWQKNINDNL